MDRIIIIQAPAHVDEKHFNLALLPAEPLHKGALANARQALHEDEALEPDALFALAAVARPPANGQLVAHLGDVLEALGAQQVGDARDGVLVEAEAREAEAHVVAEVAEGVGCGRGEGVVVCVGPVDHFLELDVAAWFEISVSGKNKGTHCQSHLANFFFFWGGGVSLQRPKPARANLLTSWLVVTIKTHL